MIEVQQIREKESELSIMIIEKRSKNNIENCASHDSHHKKQYNCFLQLN